MGRLKRKRAAPEGAARQDLQGVAVPTPEGPLAYVQGGHLFHATLLSLLRFNHLIRYSIMDNRRNPSIRKTDRNLPSSRIQAKIAPLCQKCRCAAQKPPKPPFSESWHIGTNGTLHGRQSIAPPAFLDNLPGPLHPSKRLSDVSAGQSGEPFDFPRRE